MGVQLVICVEANNTSKSDWIYIKQTIIRFYENDNINIKLSPIFMGGKYKYKEKSIVKQINDYTRQYKSVSKNNNSKVIYVVDTDNYDSNYDDKTFLDDIQKYCCSNDYDLIWFCKDIENVYLGKHVSGNQKKYEAEAFVRKKAINKVDSSKLKTNTVRIDSSNILLVLEKYLVKTY